MLMVADRTVSNSVWASEYMMHVQDDSVKA